MLKNADKLEHQTNLSRFRLAWCPKVSKGSQERQNQLFVSVCQVTLEHEALCVRMKTPLSACCAVSRFLKQGHAITCDEPIIGKLSQMCNEWQIVPLAKLTNFLRF